VPWGVAWNELVRQRKVVGIVKHQQPSGIGFKPAPDCNDGFFLLPGRALRQMEHRCDRNQIWKQGIPRFSPRPENRQVLLSMPVSVFRRGLRLAHSSQAAERRPASPFQCCAQGLQNLLACRKKRIPRIRHGPGLEKILLPLELRQRRKFGPCGLRLHTTERRHRDQRLMGEAPVKQLIFKGDCVTSTTLKNDGHVCSIFPEKNDRYEFTVFALGIVEFLGNDVAFPCRSQPESGCFLSFEPAQVGFRAGRQNEIRLFNLSVAPQRPSLGGRLHVLIDAAINALDAQAIGQSQDAIHVLRGIVSVADENLCRFGHYQELYCTGPYQLHMSWISSER